MKIKFYATLRPVVGGKAIELSAAGMTVQGMIDALLARYPDLRSHLYDPQGELYPHIHIFINGRDVQYLDDGLRSVLRPEDTVNIFPPVGGGRV
jgi:MoaD family protein